MAVKPILFNTEMVKAILDGRKTQTRRVIRFPEGMTGRLPDIGARDHIYYPGGVKYRPLRPEDILWVRETWCKIGNPNAGRPMHYCYRADMEDPSKDDMGFMALWRPSIHMPKEAARLFLRVKAVRAERLQDMTLQDSLDEGVKLRLNGIADGADPLLPFAELWNSTINKRDFSKYCWSANPWVWVIEFKRLDGEPAGLWADRDTAQWADQDVLMPAT